MRAALILVALLGCDRSDAHAPPVMVREAPATFARAIVPRSAIDVTEGLASPEAIVHDPIADVYLVSNINGAPHDKDGNGFISRIAPDGSVLEPRWIDGTRGGVKLDGPRGMALDRDTLYVVDVDAVRLFDRATGAPKASWPVPDPHFPNDIRVADDGSVLVTETGIKLTPAGPVEDGESVIWKFDRDGNARPLARGPELAGPNGIAVTPDGVVAVAFMGHDIYRIVDGKPQPIATLPQSNLDGLVQLPDGSFLVSSWQARGIYRVMPDGRWSLVMHEADLGGAASIEYDRKRQRLLIPLVLSSQLRFEPFAVP